MVNRKNIYFASDLHLGAPDPQKSLIREKHFVKWLDTIADDAAEIYLLGDVFDFWFEYKHAVPKGCIRLMGKLAELADKGIQIHFFTGNHDLWYKDYFIFEFNAKIYSEPIVKEFFGKKYYLAHGDGLGPGDHGYKVMKKIITHPFCRWMFGRLHPNFGIWLARTMSGMSSNHSYDGILAHEEPHRGKFEYLFMHARELLSQKMDIDYFVFGHRHILVDEEIEPEKHIIILGDWIQYYSFLKISEEATELNIFPSEEMLKLSTS